MMGQLTIYTLKEVKELSPNSAVPLSSSKRFLQLLTNCFDLTGSSWESPLSSASFSVAGS